MNLFRSEEHVKRWELYNPASQESIMPVADWAMVLSSPLFRERLQPDMILRAEEYWQDFFARLAELGRTGAFWA
jgi:hypothetical protein